MTTSTTTVTCPERYAPCGGKCGGEQVSARRTMRRVPGRRAEVKAPALIVQPCSYVLAQGWTGPAVVLWSHQCLAAGIVL